MSFSLVITLPYVITRMYAQNRARITGRVVPISLLEKTMVQVPDSVAILKTQADFFVELHNAWGKDVEIVQPPGLDWDKFAKQWMPCPSVGE